MNAVATLVVASILKKASSNYTNRYNNAKYGYCRLTFIQEGYCSICDTNSDSTKSKYTDNRLGHAGLYGWIYCDECIKYMKQAYTNKELSVNHLFKNTYDLHALRSISFWRKSRSNKTLPSYVVTRCSIDSVLGDGFFEHNGRLYINLKWTTNKKNEIDTTLVKSVPLSNVIYFNNNINWKYVWKAILQRSDCHSNNEWVTKWNKLFDIEYTFVYKWLYVKKAVYTFNYNFPLNAIINILDYWGELCV
mgnify:CR=1 FL=1|tara:strand:+ start:508 stop:1251 length:744 start_codon:yes stop_codon:yes gene_type:complete